MSLQIGRIAGLNEPDEWHTDGDKIQVKASYKSSGVQYDGYVKRDQLIGLVDNYDEEVVPVTITNEPRINGYYRVTHVQVPEDEWTRKQTNLYDYEIEMERVSPYRSTYFESYLNGAVRSNGIAATGDPWWAVQSNAVDVGVIGVSSSWSTSTRPTADGSGSITRNYSLGGYKFIGRWLAPIANYYDGACVVTNNDPFAHTVVGLSDAPPPDNWTISNGLVKVASLPGRNYFTFSWSDATNTYRTTANWYIGGAVGSLGAFTPMVGSVGGTRIIRNSPEEVILRVPCTTGYLQAGSAFIDFWIRRGSRCVRMYAAYPYSTPIDPMTHGMVTGVAGTTTGAGAGSIITPTVNDAYGNRMQITTASTVTNDLANTRQTTTSTVTALDAGITLELGGTTSTADAAAVQQAKDYFTAQAERMQVVVR